MKILKKNNISKEAIQYFYSHFKTLFKSFTKLVKLFAQVIILPLWLFLFQKLFKLILLLLVILFFLILLVFIFSIDNKVKFYFETKIYI